MSSNKRFTLWVVSLVVVGAAALAALYFPLRRVADEARSEEGGRGSMESAWPDADELNHFLTVREATYPIFAEKRDIIEASFIPGSPKAIAHPFLPALTIRRIMDARAAALTNHDMTLERYHELTDLVYLRWLRAERGKPYQEERLAREIAEFAEILRSDPDESLAEHRKQRYYRDREGVFARAAYLEELMAMDPEETLAAIPGEARSLLEQNRERIVSVAMGLLDSMEVQGTRAPKAGEAAAGARDGEATAAG